jgi:hypothetical protein
MAGILNIFTGNENCAAEAQCVKNGGLFIQLLPDSKQIAFGIDDDKKHPPIVFDLNSGTIINAQFPQAEPEEVVV